MNIVYASTSELLDARKRTWNMPLIRELGFPEHLFGELLEPGTVRGTLCPEVAAEVGLSPGVKVVAVGSHDTASAVHAVLSARERRRSVLFSAPARGRC